MELLELPQMFAVFSPDAPAPALHSVETSLDQFLAEGLDIAPVRMSPEDQATLGVYLIDHLAGGDGRSREAFTVEEALVKATCCPGESDGDESPGDVAATRDPSLDLLLEAIPAQGNSRLTETRNPQANPLAALI